jgi:hypothetical protein
MQPPHTTRRGRAPTRARVVLGDRSRSTSPTRDGAESVASYGDDECPVFIDREGNMVEVMCCDYGLRRWAVVVVVVGWWRGRCGCIGERRLACWPRV